jgi:hypothetical protein
MGNKIKTIGWLLKTVFANLLKSNSTELLTISPDFVNGKQNLEPITPKPYYEVTPATSTQNPFMKTGTSHMHGNSYNLNVSDHNTNIPYATTIQLKQIAMNNLGIGGQCVGTYFLSSGVAITISASIGKFHLLAINPETFTIYDKFELPGRNGDILKLLTLNFYGLTQNTSGGTYMYIDQNENIVIAAADDTIKRINLDATNKKFKLIETIDMSKYTESIVSLLPDFNGNIWMVNSEGEILIYSPQTSKLILHTTLGETIENSFAISSDSAYILTTEHLYRFDTNSFEPVWAATYKHVNFKKPGTLSVGSGSTPTILGPYVVITDNTDEYIHANFYSIDKGNLVYRVRLPFQPYHGANECSVVGFSPTQVIIVNTYGYKSFDEVHACGLRPTPGIVMININPEYSSNGYIQWYSNECPSTSLPIVTKDHQFLIIYSMDLAESVNTSPHFSITFIDTATGSTIRKIRTGYSTGFDNNWCPIHLGPDGSIYSGTLNGIIQISAA